MPASVVLEDACDQNAKLNKPEKDCNLGLIDYNNSGTGSPLIVIEDEQLR